ncbi:MAG: S46 family peptidase [Bacteroidales bacterium]
MKKLLALFALLIIFIPVFKADEGIWIPVLLEKYNIKDMQDKGFRLTADDIYSINKASMKDAVLMFGGGCTGELISDQGLLITNHHCGYGSIQKHSSLEHDYLTNGFWAMSASEELPNPGLTVTLLDRMEDVTKLVLVNISENMNEEQRQAEIQKQIKKIELSASENGKFRASVRPFFYGNEYYLFVSKVFRDVRFVGAPPSGIGKFGGDTDNWMWPRHTGDFSLFRIYVNKNNEPADYSPDNVPYKPKMHFSISLKGVKKNDFTMVFGYPGRTQEYLTSYAVELITNIQNPLRINIRQNKIDIMAKYMNESAAVRIQYSAKYAGISNGWKKWMGENRGLKRMDAINKKQEFEKSISEWINSSEALKSQYSALLPAYSELYSKLSPYQKAYDCYNESIFSMEIIRLVNAFKKLTEFTDSTKTEEINDYVVRLTNSVNSHFKDYYQPLDEEMFSKMLELYFTNMEQKFIPGDLKQANTKFKGNYTGYVKNLYAKTIFTSQEKLLGFLKNYKISMNKKLEKDVLFQLNRNFDKIFQDSIAPTVFWANSSLVLLDRLWMKAIMEFKSGKILYPDANSTLRVAYGKVDEYYPVDGVKYLFYTTLKGIMEKENPEIYDYTVPEKLKQLYKDKDYGDYAENGEMHVAFIASNHTTGGNSGSPVLNADGQLIGVNFDRNWEGTMSDIMYDPDMCRNISLDIRYALFIIDKLAGAKHLINEMTLIR